MSGHRKEQTVHFPEIILNLSSKEEICDKTRITDFQLNGVA